LKANYIYTYSAFTSCASVNLMAPAIPVALALYRDDDERANACRCRVNSLARSLSVNDQRFL